MRKVLDSIAAVLVLIGALNWGLVGLFEWDLVAEICGEEFGTTNAVSRVIYVIVGIAAVYGIGSLVERLRSGEGMGARATA